MSATLERAIRLRAGLEAKTADPLSRWRFAVPRLREAFAMFTGPEPISELHLRACNKGTKTETTAAYVLACLKKLRHLDGVPLPQWRGRVEAAMFSLDFPAQIMSVQPAWERLLGRWPHHVRKDGEILKSVSVMPAGGSDNEDEWSIVHFFSQENRKSGVGVRADIAAFDEPPVMDILREMRKAAHAGRKGIRLIAETPTIRRQWAPLRDDYGDCPRKRIRRVDRYRAECRWSLEEVASWVLSEAEKDELRYFWSKEPYLKDAREHGDYANTEGDCPFDINILQAMYDDCGDPPAIVKWRVTVEKTEMGEPGEQLFVPVEVWEEAREGMNYYEDIDPASGAGAHSRRQNPAGLHMSEIGSGDLVARWNGYLPPYSLGNLGAGLARTGYNNAACDIEMMDHWGVNVYRGFRDAGYGNLCKEQRELEPGKWANEVGFLNNKRGRARIVGGVQQWVGDWGAGKKYARCRSRRAIETLMDCQVDERGLIVAAPGVDHGEDLILLGQKLTKPGVVSRSFFMRENEEKIWTNEDQANANDLAIARMIRGEDRDDGPPGEWGGEAPMWRERSGV